MPHNKVHAMSTEITLKKSETLPQFLQELFQRIDQGIGFVGAFDKRLPKYEHVMKDMFVGDYLTIFDGLLRVWMGAGSSRS
jgi:hypothetical protein